MKKMFLILMLVVLSSLSFAARGDKGQSGGDFYGLYNAAYEAAGTPAMHKEYGIKSNEADKVIAIINKGWYEIKLLEADKLKEVFTIDMLLLDGPQNKDKVKDHMNKIKSITADMNKVYEGMKDDLNKVMDADKLEN